MHIHPIKMIKRLLLPAGLLLCSLAGYSQPDQLFVDLSPVDGIELTQANILSFRINNRSSRTVQAEISGRVQYRRSQMGFSYRFTTMLQPGVNTFAQQAASVSWTFPQAPLKELFQLYNKLPEGTYEYCVSAAIKQGSGTEMTALNDPDACVYYTVEDLFLINLIDPEDDAKIYEYHPMLSWAVNYPFASELSYRLRVAERKSGQNKQNAITRNNPMYQDNRVMSTAAVYPPTGRPLQLWQPYVWAVDAYYKGILLGGSEVWQFTIIEDSALKPVPVVQSYYEFERHHDETVLNAIGSLRLKYVSRVMHDTLSLELYDAGDNRISIPEAVLPLQLGDNYLEFLIMDKINLTHNNKYRLVLRSTEQKQFSVPFIYHNPLYIKQ